jgi:Tfp pilus assembly protein PilX
VSRFTILQQRWRRRGTRRREGGAVLLIVLLVMMTLLCLGVTSVWMTGGNLQMSAAMNLRSQALYCAQAGIERAKAHLNTAPPSGASAFLTGLLGSSGNSQDDVPSMLDDYGQPKGNGAVLVDGTGALENVAYPPNSFGRAASAEGMPLATQMGTYTVWVRNDLAEARQGNFLTDSNGSVVVRSRCVAADGRTNATLEVTFIPPLGQAWSPLAAECLDSGKNNDDANTNTVHCNRSQ